MGSPEETRAVLKKGRLKKFPIRSRGIALKRFFELTEEGLSYFAEKKNQLVKKNSIPLDIILSVEKYKTSKKEFCVQAKEAHSSPYTLRMYAETEKETDEWMKAIENARRKWKEKIVAKDSESVVQEERVEEKEKDGDSAPDGAIAEQAASGESPSSQDQDSVSASGNASVDDPVPPRKLSIPSDSGDDETKYPSTMLSPVPEGNVICLHLKEKNLDWDEEESDDDVKTKSLGRQSRSDSRPYITTNQWELPDTSGYRPLHKACQEGNAEKVLEILSQNVSLEAIDSQKRYPPVFHAYTHDHKKILKLLLEKGASPDGEEKVGGSTLLHFCAERNDAEVAALLFDHNADVNKVDYAGKSPLHVACAHASLAFVKFLLERGASVDAVANGQTPLSIASERGDLNIVELLLKSRATVPHTNDNRRKSAYIIAVENKHEKIAELLKEALPENFKPYKCSKILKGHQESITSVAISETFLASGAGDGQVILWNLENGTRVNTLSLGDSIVSLSFWEQYLAAGSQLAVVFDLKSPGWKLELGQSIGMIADENRPLQMVAFSADGHLATADIDRNVVEIWSIGPIEGRARHPLHTIVADERLGDRDGVCQSMQFSPDTSRTLLALSIQPGSRLKPVGNNIIHIVNWKSEQLFHCIDTGVGVDCGLMATDTVLSFSLDGKYIAVGFNNGEVKMWEVYGYKRLVHQFMIEQGCGVRSLAFSSLYAHFAIGMDSGTVHVYSFALGNPLFVLSDGKKPVTSLAFSFNGQYLLSGCEDRLLRIYEAPIVNPVLSDSQTVCPTYPPTKALTENGELSDTSKRFWRQKFNEFDEDEDGFLNLKEFDKLYCEFKNEHMLPQGYNNLCRNQKVEMIDIDTLFNLAADWLWKDGEQMWLTWKKNGYADLD